MSRPGRLILLFALALVAAAGAGRSQPSAARAHEHELHLPLAVSSSHAPVRHEQGVGTPALLPVAPELAPPAVRTGHAAAARAWHPHLRLGTPARARAPPRD